ISFEVRPGSTHALVGESGSGKTTTGRMISLFETPTAGSITVDGVDILAANAAERKELRSNIQLVYQNPYSSLDPRMRIGDIIAEPFRNFTRASKSKAQARAKEYLELVSLDADMYARRPRSEEHTSELQSRLDLVCRLLLVRYGHLHVLRSFPTRRSSDLSNIQLVYQNPYSSLDPRMRIGDIIAEPFRNFTRASKSKAQARAKEYLELVSLDADMYARRP